MSNDIESLVSTEWLAQHLGEDRLVVLDATRHLPAANRDARAEYEAAHIPGARFLDLESLTDASSPVPQALPSQDQLSERLDSLGIAPEDRIVIYDDSDVKTSARAWFTLISHGIEDVAILDGGLAKWKAEGRPLESGTPDFAPVETGGVFSPERVASKQDMLENLESEVHQVVDARGADRVFGTGDDPVHGGACGRIPGSLNVPFGEVFNADGTFKSRDELREVFERAGVDLTRPIITTCGSGVTASVLLFALHLIGEDDARLYDGSWLEWSADPDTLKAQGPA
ncbi:3-mercaptopyruvate sulfurtransferase [Erythrobacter sp. THAF29]|uniref:3-mercaptopyruvate sulfurtransferase n=1 Tax=Erythrobacter sp. THAF29 TaxID=2587851 RepID=UPI0012AA321E|nr:3-mercaptopyruvate sulfurtransferase [Erythrobacter sp. THAF29]QFT77093.1 3-mercaptopyruvate sulfurtransferase [Erythrobacter sp. THAF29]